MGCGASFDGANLSNAGGNKEIKTAGDDEGDEADAKNSTDATWNFRAEKARSIGEDFRNKVKGFKPRILPQVAVYNQ